MIPNFEPDLTEPAARTAFLEHKTTDSGGSSPIGHHYIQLYNQNKWSFYLRYVRGLRPRWTKPALTFGGAIHDAKEAFYRSDGDADFMIDTFAVVLDARRHEYEHAEDYDLDLVDGRKMLYVWGNTYGESDLTDYDIIEVEGSHTFQLPNGMSVSVRWDLLTRERATGRYYLFDTKTTRYSIQKSFQSVAGQDQVTMYLLGLSYIYPDVFRQTNGLIPDILYKRQSVVKAERPAVVTRSRNELTEYVQELIGLHTELSQKIAAIEAGFPYPHLLFPRNGKDDAYFGSEWPDIYRSRLPDDPSHAPPGYIVDRDILDNGPLSELASKGPVSFDAVLKTIPPVDNPDGERRTS